MYQDSNSQHLDVFHISPCPLPSEAVAHSPSVEAAEDTAWGPFPFSAISLGLFLPTWGSRMPHSQLCADLPELMIPLSFGPRESGFPGAGCGHRFLTLQHSSVRIGEIDDFWGISYCFSFTLAFVCKPRNALCVSLTLPSQPFREHGRCSRLPKCLFLIPDGMLLQSCRWRTLPGAPEAWIWACTQDPTFPAWCSAPLPGTQSSSEGTKAVWSCSPFCSPWAPEQPKSHRNHSLHPHPSSLCKSLISRNTSWTAWVLILPQSSNTIWLSRLLNWEIYAVCEWDCRLFLFQLNNGNKEKQMLLLK